MIEIMLGVWFVCFCLSMITVGINFHLTRKKLQSKTLQRLNTNLGKAGLFWSNALGDFAPLTDEAIARDAHKTLRDTLLMGALGLASVLGFILVLMLVLSINLLARSRKEMATFRSALANDTDLTKEEVELLVKEFAQIY